MPFWPFLSAAGLATDTPEIVARRNAYAQCPSSALLTKPSMRLSWTPVPSAIDRHVALYQRYHFAMPAGRRQIMLFFGGGHGAWSNRSTIATRGKHGLWHVDGLGDETLWLVTTPPQQPMLDQHDSRELDREESRKLDSVLRDPCLRVSPAELGDMDHPPYASETMDIVTPKGHWTFSWAAKPVPQVQAILDLLTRS